MSRTRRTYHHHTHAHLHLHHPHAEDLTQFGALGPIYLATWLSTAAISATSFTTALWQDPVFLGANIAGHAFKYFPLIGREILKIIQRKPSPQFAQAWSFARPAGDTGADHRSGEVQEIREDDLASIEHLKGGGAQVLVAA